MWWKWFKLLLTKSFNIKWDFGFFSSLFNINPVKLHPNYAKHIDTHRADTETEDDYNNYIDECDKDKSTRINVDFTWATKKQNSRQTIQQNPLFLIVSHIEFHSQPIFHQHSLHSSNRKFQSFWYQIIGRNTCSTRYSKDIVSD